MRRIITLLIICFYTNSNAQDTNVEKSIFGIQTGVGTKIGIYINNESRLSNSLAIRSEIGLEKDFTVGSHYENTGFILQPVLTVEPRYYYNLVKRNSRGKNTNNNSGNYISIKTSYHPDWFVINLPDNVTKIADLGIIPTWGIKRQLGNQFTFETALGLGYRKVFIKENATNGNIQNVDGDYDRNQYIPYLNVGFGYVF